MEAVADAIAALAAAAPTPGGTRTADGHRTAGSGEGDR
jgi:hypothetical protein